MKNNTPRAKNTGKLHSYYGVFVAFTALCLLVCLFSFQYYSRLHATIREESRNYLQEVSLRIGKNLDIVIQDNFAMLYTMGESLEAGSAFQQEEIYALLQKQKTHWNAEKILLIDKSGKAYTINGSRSTFLTLDETMRTNLLSKTAGMATTQIVDNKEYLLFTVPLDHVEIDGESVIAIAACYDPAELDQILSMTSFGGQAYSQIITKSGTVITRSNSSYAMKSGYNLFSTLETASMDKGYNLDKMKNDMKSDIADQISFSIDGVHRYMVYTPIQPDEWYLMTFVPFQAVNEKSDMLLRSTLLICGLIALTFCALIGTLLYVSRKNRQKLERIAYVDDVTGGNTIQRFYTEAEDLLTTAPENVQYALVYTNIENFKVLNAQLGRKSCDAILSHFYTYAASTLQEDECIGRLFADNFCMLVRYQDEVALVERFEQWGNGAEQYIQEQQLSWGMPGTEFGVYVIENTTLPFPEMIDRAKLALKETARALGTNSRLHLTFYDDNARRQLFREKQLADMMEAALANKEFLVFLQPKYHLPEDEIGGAEALVRWKSASEGMIYPNEFIPLFEKNGFIVQVDLFVFEEVCRKMRAWLDAGLTPVKVSINCSRVHFRNAQFLMPYIRIATQYDIDRSLLEIELTESVVFEDTAHLTKIIQEIKAAGFGCSMDDFGSGYSSLNLLQTIPVDTLKIDKIFFQGGAADMERTEALVGSIVQMAQSLMMVTVAEGVEYPEQVAMLKRVGCDYIQGYVFAKPMDIEAFEKLAFNETESSKG